jgi:Icc protein
MSEALLTFVHISDTHISPDSDYGVQGGVPAANATAEALVRELRRLPFEPDFVLHTGDVIYDPVTEAYEYARAILGQIPFPVYYVAGNHDDADGLQRVLLGRAEPQVPFCYEVNRNGVQGVVLDSNGPAEPPRGNLVREQLAWLAQTCDPADPRPLWVGVHHNILAVGSAWLDEYMRTTNGDELHQALLPLRGRLRGVFYGHVHQSLTTVRDGILYTSAPSAWVVFRAWPGSSETVREPFPEPGFNVVTITAEQTFVRRWSFRV